MSTDNCEASLIKTRHCDAVFKRVSHLSPNVCTVSINTCSYFPFIDVVCVVRTEVEFVVCSVFACFSVLVDDQRTCRECEIVFLSRIHFAIATVLLSQSKLLAVCWVNCDSILVRHITVSRSECRYIIHPYIIPAFIVVLLLSNFN